MTYIILPIVLFFGFPRSTLGSGIIGGRPTLYYPFFVSIRVGSNSCGGTLIAPNAVLTTARCLFRQDRNRYAHVGEVQIFKYSETSTQLYRCKSYQYQYFHNPDTNHGVSPFDIAITTLAECLDLRDPQNAILPICAWYMIGTPAGFAIGTEKIPGIAEAIQVEALLIQYRPCARYFTQHRIAIDENKQVCYGAENENAPAGVCYGAFGGPLIHKGWPNTNDVCLIGIASFNSRTCNHPSLPSIFTNATFFSSAILQAMVSARESCEFMK